MDERGGEARWNRQPDELGGLGFEGARSLAALVRLRASAVAARSVDGPADWRTFRGVVVSWLAAG